MSPSGEETAASRSIGPWIDQRFRNTHRLGVGERIVERGQWVGPAADILPGHFGGVPLEHRQRTKEMPRLAAPAAADLEMLAVDVLVNVDRGVANVRVMAGHDVASAVTHQP